MSRRITRRPQAQTDIIDHALYLAKEGDLELADRFLERLEQTLTMLSDLPDIGSPRLFEHEALRDVRILPVQGFDSHLVFYIPRETEVEVIRVLHAARDVLGEHLTRDGSR